MKKFAVIVDLVIIAVFVLAGCDGFTLPGFPTPTPLPPPQAENAAWKIKIVSIEKYSDPAELACSDCATAASEGRLHLPKGHSFMKVTALVLNQSHEEQTVSVHNIGVELSMGPVGCSSLTVQGSEKCMLAGIVRGEKTYVNHGLQTAGFEPATVFAAGSDQPETVEFIFIVDAMAKPSDFYFADLPALDVHRMKMQLSTK